MVNQAKRAIKRGLQQFAAHLGPQVRTPSSPRLLVLMYHRVLPPDDDRTRIEEPGMMVTPDTFRQHLLLLNQYFEVLHLSDWLARRASGGHLPAKACALTFDDGWADNHEFAWPLLQETGTRATIFLVSDMIGTNRQFWPERLSHLLQVIATRHSEYWSDARLAWLRKTGTRYAFSHAPPTPDELAGIIAAVKKLGDEEVHERLDMMETLPGMQTGHEAAPPP